MINKVFLIGHLGQDPEVRSLPSGRPVTNFSMATNRKWKDRESGEQQEQTEWHRVVCFGRQAEIAGEYLTKGRLVFVEGRLQTRSWEDRETGKKMFRTEVICDNFQMLGGRSGDVGPAPDRGSYAGEPSDDAGPADDDIPF